jgi:hypothetical protein
MKKMNDRHGTLPSQRFFLLCASEFVAAATAFNHHRNGSNYFSHFPSSKTNVTRALPIYIVLKKAA